MVGGEVSPGGSQGCVVPSDSRLVSSRQLQQQQQAELDVHQRDGLAAYDLSQVRALVPAPRQDPPVSPSPVVSRCVLTSHSLSVALYRFQLAAARLE